MADSIGEFSFNEQYFEKALEEHLKRERREPTLYKVICPLVGFKSETGRIELPSNFGFEKSEWYVELKDAKISKMAPRDWAGIFNSTGTRSLRGVERSSWGTVTHKLELEMRGRPADISERQVIKSICSALRLYKPKEPPICGGPHYPSGFGPFKERFDIPHFEGCGPRELTPESVFMSETFPLRERGQYEFTEEDADGFRDFWEKYGDYLNGERDSKVSAGLRRYDEMYTDIYPEDKLIDCVIGFEGTLLKDLGKQSSFTFRLKTRSALLLESRLSLNKEEIRQFFQNLYFVRGEIVHQDKNLGEVINDSRFKDGEETTTGEFVHVSRKVFAETIIAYLDAIIDRDMSITEVNQELDQRVLDSS